MDTTLAVLVLPKINRFRGNHSRIHHQPTQEVIMEIAIAMGGLVAIFVGLGALILFTPYEK
jgi:hypothetical protein